MSWERRTKSKLSLQEVAEQVLQIYMKCLQDQKSLKSILSEYSVLDYFGKVFYGQDKVSAHLIANLHGSNYELSSLSTNNQPMFVDWDHISETHEKSVEDLGVHLISPPKLTFPSLTFSTPVRSVLPARKRTASEASVDKYNNDVKLHKTEKNNDESSCSKNSDGKTNQGSLPLTPQTYQMIFPNDICYLTAYGTIRYPKRIFPTMDPKRIKHHSLVTLRDRFCQLFIGFECDEHVISVTNCKIWTIKYSVSSRVTPRNLLKSFNEVDFNC